MTDVHEPQPEVRAAHQRSPWRSVVIPSEHGGWGLTLEPVLLGLLLAPSIGTFALGLAAFMAFLVRTPLKLVAIDLRHHRWLERSSLALRIAVIELLLASVLVTITVVQCGWRWLVPVAVAVPLVAVESWFDFRSHSRRLVPELCGAMGIAAVAPAILLAGGESVTLTVGVWLVLAARVAGSIPYVRVQIMRLRRGVGAIGGSDLAQVAAVAIAILAALVDHRLVLGAIAIVAMVGCHVAWVRRPPLAAKIVGLREMAIGLAIVLVTAAGITWS